MKEFRYDWWSHLIVGCSTVSTVYLLNKCKLVALLSCTELLESGYGEAVSNNFFKVLYKSNYDLIVKNAEKGYVELFGPFGLYLCIKILKQNFWLAFLIHYSVYFMYVIISLFFVGVLF